MEYPILYSFRRCPYAMRARMAIVASGLTVELREVQLKNKPAEMLEASPKATVPVLVLADKTVLDESLDIMSWALTQNDPRHWLNIFSAEQRNGMDALINENDTSFKQQLDHYKYADRFPAFPAEYYREKGEVFLQNLNTQLENTNYLFAETASFADIAIFPFIRQFANVDYQWFENSAYSQLRRWLERLISSSYFIDAMKKHPNWDGNDGRKSFL